MARRGGRPSRVPPPPPNVVAGPSEPREASPVPPQFFVIRPIYRCTHCGSERVSRNGGSPTQTGYAHFVCHRCADDNGDARTFKLPVA